MYRVFIVDDEPLICKGLRETVEWDSLGLEISGEAHNGIEAMALIAATHPHILITDIRMPGMDGISLIKAIREHDLNTRIIILSGFSDYRFLKEAIRLGVDGYLLKPIDTDELISNLCNLVHVIEEEMLKSARMYQGMELLRTNTLNRLVSNEIGRSEFDEKAALLDLSLDAEHYLCAVCLPLGEADGAEGCADPKIALALQDDASLRNGGRGIAFVDPKNRLTLLLYGKDEAALHTDAQTVLRRMTERAQAELGCALACAVGDSVGSREEIPLAYASALGKLPSGRPQDADTMDTRWKSVVNRTRAFVCEHYHEALSLKQIAGLCDINTSYLGQVFRKATGESFTNYVNRYRVERAKELLAQTTLKVYEVSERVGFTDYHYFLKIFKKVTGIVPTDTRCENFCHRN